ncbi:MAG: ABC transporter permease [Dehalococcoidia bacterium]
MAEAAERVEAAPVPLEVKRDWRLTWLRVKEQGFFFMLVMPAVLLVAIFLIFPLWRMLALSFGSDDFIGKTVATSIDYKFSTIDQYDRAITGVYVNVFDEIPEVEVNGVNRVIEVSRKPVGDLNGDGAVTVDDVIVKVDGERVPIQEMDDRNGIITLLNAPDPSMILDEIPRGVINGHNKTYRLYRTPIQDSTGDGRVDDTDVVVTVDGVEVPIRRIATARDSVTLETAPAIGSEIRIDYLGNSLGIDYLVGDKAGPSVYHTLFKTTFQIAFLTTFIALLIGYPVAYLLANVSDKARAILLPLVVVPFWTDILVRTFAWRIILGRKGFINEVLDWLNLRGVAGDLMQALDKIDFLDIIQLPASFQDPTIEGSDVLPLVFNRLGTVLGMVHILVPFMIFPLFAVMRGIPNEYLRAAENLGAGPYMAFRRVYFPLTLPGLGAGVLITFILSLGFFITPALLGGPKDRMVSNIIQEQIDRANNWEFAAALAFMLLAVTIILYLIYARFMSFEKLYGEQR